jgi:putative spermidine/putrescine transport system ATP-binding protein
VSTQPNPAVRVEAVRKAYGPVTAVQELDLAIGRGELVTLLGPSGCGKTTILRMIAGFVRPSSGSISIAGTCVNDLPPHKRQVGLMFQSYALFPHMTVGENIAFGLKMRGVLKDEIKQRVLEALQSVRLDARVDAYPRQLSGGQQQRVALARALVIKPDVLLLDEPFGALDRELRQHLQGEMKHLQRNLGISTLLVTHDQEEALMLSDRIVVMNAGRVEQVGTATDVFERPKTRFVAEFMGGTNIFDGAVRERPGSGGLEFVLANSRGALPLPPDIARTARSGVVMIRPERLRVSPIPEGAIVHSSPLAMTGRIVAANYLGTATEFQIAIDGQMEFVLVARRASETAAHAAFSVGMPVSIDLPPEAVQLVE